MEGGGGEVVHGPQNYVLLKHKTMCIFRIYVFLALPPSALFPPSPFHFSFIFCASQREPSTKDEEKWKGEGGSNPCATELCISEAQNYVFFRIYVFLALPPSAPPPPLPLSFFLFIFCASQREPSTKDEEKMKGGGGE